MEFKAGQSYKVFTEEEFKEKARNEAYDQDKSNPEWWKNAGSTWARDHTTMDEFFGKIIIIDEDEARTLNSGGPFHVVGSDGECWTLPPYCFKERDHELSFLSDIFIVPCFWVAWVLLPLAEPLEYFSYN